MKIIYFVFFLLIFVIGLLFSLRNLNLVSVDFYYARIDLPLALILTLQLIVGVVLGLMVGFGWKIRSKLECSKLNKKLTSTERALEKLRSSMGQ